ncbi:peroxisomal succinyl-coenzyme A thioesterase isoform X3 [Amia ocellicauda]|uniref:peroxisomal succinyl-coenzyme A thioesterase isoform X3 n=2 Tax=Amia ocellicauda TaxID=2972642 RepID=UPI0034645F98
MVIYCRSTMAMAGKGSCPLITIQPSRGLIDEKFQITVKNLLPGQAVTLHSLTQSEDSDFWEAFGHYVSDGKGTVKVAEDVSLGGSYDGLEPMGLLWSMKPAPGSRPGLRFRKKDVNTPLVMRIYVYKGHMRDGFNAESALACAVTERSYMAPGVRRTEISQDGVLGTLFVPPGPGPFPAVLDMWGGGGGLVEYRSALLASHGFVSLALEYFSSRTMGNASEKNPLTGNEYFEAAFIILKEHPQVASEWVALLGLSFGTSVALGMAVYSSVIQPSCVVCISGSHVQPVKESISGVFAEFGKNVHKTRYDENNYVIWRDLLLPIPTDPNKKVDLGRIKCPLLLIVGEDDQNWPAAESAEDMERMMETAGNRHLLTTLSYPGAGHLIEPPYSPHVRFSNFMLLQEKKKVVVLWGGETKLHSYAQEDSWQKILAFLEQHLYHNHDTTPQ